MTTESETSASDPGTVRLAAAHRAAIDLGRAIEALANLDWLGVAQANPSPAGEGHRVTTVLALEVADGSSAGPIRKSALVDIGPVNPTDAAVSLDVGWQSDSIAPLFPVFAGRLEISPDGLFLEGRYAPPFGRLGLLIDERILHFIARRTAEAFLARLATRMAVDLA